MGIDQRIALPGDCFKRMNDEGGWLYMQLIEMQNGMMLSRTFVYIPHEDSRRKVIIQEAYYDDGEAARSFTKISHDELQTAWESLMNLVSRDLAPRHAGIKLIS